MLPNLTLCFKRVGDYLYDSNGNMTRDENKHINVQYSHLNLPIEVYKGQRMKTLRYTYDASGTKHKKVYYGQGVRPQTTTYTPLAVYKNDSLEFVHTPEGYAKLNYNGDFIHTYQYKDHLGNNRLSYADSNKNGKIDTPYTSGVTVWEDDFEDKSTGDWESVGAMYGRKITGFDTTKAHSGTKSGYIKLNTNGKWTDYYVHSNEWIAINNTKPTLYRYSGWVYMEASVYRAQFFLHMKDADETWYCTQFDEVTTHTKGKWVYMEKIVLIPPEIKTFNFRIDADSSRNGTVWYDDLKIEKLDMSKNEILSETNYYPFGMQHKGYNEQVSSSNLGEKYKYANKEFEEELDVNTIAFGWRDYDPATARFNKIDRFAEKYSSMSTYQFAANNPLMFKEIQGDSLVAVTLTGLNRENPIAKKRNYLVDSKIAENIVGFVMSAQEKFNNLSVNNIFRNISSSDIETNNTKSNGSSRHEGGFAIDLNGVGRLSKNELGILNEIASEFGLNPLKKQSEDLPHYSTDPVSTGYSGLAESINENKGHFNEILRSTKDGKGEIRTSALKDKEGNIIGVRFERGNNTKSEQQDFNKLIQELISNAR